MVDIQKELKENPILLSVFSSEYYSKLMINLLQNLENGKICYVTLNRPTDSLIRRFELNKISTKNIFFIDAITRSISGDKEFDKGILVSSPSALTELSIAISEVQKTKKFDMLIFDSLSTLKIYSNENTAIRFTSDLINKLRSKKDKGIFTCLEGDVKTNLIEQSSVYVDEILNFKGMHEEMRKNEMKKIGSSLTFIVTLLAVFFFLGSGNNAITGLAFSPIIMETNITPSSLSNSRNSFNLGIIIQSHLS